MRQRKWPIFAIWAKVLIYHRIGFNRLKYGLKSTLNQNEYYSKAYSKTLDLRRHFERLKHLVLRE
jgi:hypothetical protein